jgi:hypothetical protein
MKEVLGGFVHSSFIKMHSLAMVVMSTSDEIHRHYATTAEGRVVDLPSVLKISTTKPQGLVKG